MAEDDKKTLCYRVATCILKTALFCMTLQSDLCVQKDDPLLSDVEIDSTALVPSSLLDLLRLSSEYIRPV